MADAPAPASPRAALLQPEQRVDHFSIVRPLGHGGFGEVYLARDTRLGRRVALKIVHPRHLGSDEAVQRFLFEARATARFSHPHIVTVYAVGEHEGMPYVALEYLEGRTLRQKLQEGPIARGEALRTALAIAEALQEAHAGGILHRDLKPENILLAKDGRLRVLDFGLAKRIDVSRGPSEASAATEAIAAARAAAVAPTEVMSRPFGSDTSPDASADTLDSDAAGATLGATLPPAGQKSTAPTPLLIEGDAAQTLGNGFDSSVLSGVRGTPFYMAPEQWAAAPQSTAVDLWAFGVLLHELLTGTFPFEARQPIAIGHEVCSAKPLPLALDEKELATELSRLVTDCLDKDPAVRPTAARAVEVLRDLLSSGRAELAEEQGPFRGLLPFSERHAGLYFGREAELAAFLELLRDEPVLAVVGPSGAGKSSFVAAGVVPRLREQARTVLLRLRPGTDPFGALASRLRSGEQLSSQLSRDSATVSAQLSSGAALSAELQPASATDEVEALAAELRSTPTRLGLLLRKLADEQQARVVLFVDQLEELFTQSPPAQRLRFMQALASASDDAQEPVRTIVTLRDDFLGRLAEGDAARRVLSRIVVLRSPDRAALEAILTRSLAAFGYRYEDDRIVGEMIEAIDEEPAALPLLSFAGRMLWQRRERDRRVLPRAAYEQMGGVAGALATHADAVLQGLSSEQQATARVLLLRLITPEGTRRAMPRAALLEGLGEQGHLVLTRLTEARLLTVSQGGVDGAQHELAHETLVTSWKRLARWLDESREERAFLAEIEQAAQLWLRRGRRDDEVWSGDALDDARRGLARCEVVPELVAEFIAAAEGQARAQAQAARRRRAVMRGAIAGAVIALVLVTIAWGLALRTQARKASVARDAAITQLARAHSEGAALALRQGDPQRARAMLRSALEAGLWRGKLNDEMAQQLRFTAWRLDREPLLWRSTQVGRARTLVFSPDGRELLTVDERVQRFDVASGRARLVEERSRKITGAAYTPDGRCLALGDVEGKVVLRCPGAPERTYRAPASRVRSWALSSLRFSQTYLYAQRGQKLLRWVRNRPSDAPRAVTVRWPRDLRVVGDDLHYSTGMRQVLRHRGFGAKGEVVGRATAAQRGYAMMGQSVALGDIHAYIANMGTQFAALHIGRRGAIVRNRLAGHTQAMAGEPKNGLLAVGQDGAFRLWDALRGEELAKIELRDKQHGRSAGKVAQLAFSPDGRLLAAQTHDGLLTVWRVSLLRERREVGHAGQISGLAVRPDGRWVVSAGGDATLRYWDGRTGRQRLVVPLDHVAAALAYRPDGAELAVGARSVSLYDGESGAFLRRLGGHGAALRDLAYDPTGKRLASVAYGDRRLRIWKLDEGTQLDFKLPAPGSSVAWRPDGRMVAVGLPYSRTAMVLGVELATGKQHVLMPQLGKRVKAVRSVTYDPRGDLAVRLTDGELFVAGRQLPRPAWALDQSLRTTIDAPGNVTFHSRASVWGARASTIISVRRSDRRVQRALMGLRVGARFLETDASGKLIAVGAADGSVRLWHPGSRLPVGWTSHLALDPPRVLTPQGVARFVGRAGTAPAERPGRQWERAAMQAQGVRTAGDTLCLVDPRYRLELWDTRQDRRLGRWQLDLWLRSRDLAHRTPGRFSTSRTHHLGATSGACLVMSGTTLIAYRAQGVTTLCERCQLTVGARALVSKSGKVMRPEAERLRPLGATSQAASGTRNYAIDLGDLIAVGAGRRQLELFDAGLGKKVGVLFGDVDSLVSARQGPARTVMLGDFAGRFEFVRYDLRRLAETIPLHGPVSQIVRAPGRVYIATELGDTRVLDVAPLELDECALLRRVWATTPLVWRAGRLQVAPIPSGHRCAPPSAPHPSRQRPPSR